jgi:hypothetical protein
MQARRFTGSQLANCLWAMAKLKWAPAGGASAWPHATPMRPSVSACRQAGGSAAPAAVALQASGWMPHLRPRGMQCPSSLQGRQLCSPGH